MKSLKLFLAVLYIPIFAAIFISPYSGTFYLLIYASLFILVMLQKRNSNRYFIMNIVLFIKFSIVFIILNSFHLVDGNELLMAVRQSLPFAIVLGLILFLSKYNQEELTKLIERAFHLAGIMFIIQFILSAYESINNIYLVKDFNWALSEINKSTIESRFILNIFSININFLSIFTHAFSGLLGHHNYWAVQLPFYNLFFLILYHKSGKTYYLVLIALVLIAILLNTTRAGIITILLTDIFYVLFLNKRKNKTYYVIAYGTLFLLIYSIFMLAVNLSYYFEQTDTLTVRSEWYTAFYQQIIGSGLRLFFGYGISQIDQIMVNIRAYNFESAFFSILFENGLMGLSLFIIFLVKIIIQGRKFSFINKYFSYLIVFNIVGVSATIGGVITFYAFQFVALIYIYNVITDPSYNEALALQTALLIKNNT
ncbi:MAG: hypothetical protein Q8K60_07235 [Parachlamydiaceae bacterium]|nr:hypothetical protein [Parachlamydiaceae bacterium]